MVACWIHSPNPSCGTLGQKEICVLSTTPLVSSFKHCLSFCFFIFEAQSLSVVPTHLELTEVLNLQSSGSKRHVPGLALLVFITVLNQLVFSRMLR